MFIELLFVFDAELDVHGSIFADPIQLNPNEANPWMDPVAPERIWKWGAPIRREAQEKNCVVVPLHFFGSKSTISRFGERFCDGQYSLVSFLFAVFPLTVPPVPSHL